MEPEKRPEPIKEPLTFFEIEEQLGRHGDRFYAVVAVPLDTILSKTMEQLTDDVVEPMVIGDREFRGSYVHTKTSRTG